MRHNRIWLAVLLVVTLQVSAAVSINSTMIATDVLAALPQCLHYQVTGICTWLKDGVTLTTFQVAHNLPDIVASSYNEVGDNAWLEANTYDQAAAPIAQNIVKSVTGGMPLGGGQHAMSAPQTQNARFKEIDLIGNPVLIAFKNPLLLPSTAIPYQPYFLSLLDAYSWRSGIEMLYPQTWNPLRHVIGSPFANWGSVYPREGLVDAANDAITAAVAVQRAGDVITQPHQAHIYQLLKTNCGQSCTAALIQENNTNTTWQMIYPVADTTCRVFGKPLNWGDDLGPKTQGQYLWVLWRHYQGCLPVPGGQLISVMPLKEST